MSYSIPQSFWTTQTDLGSQYTTNFCDTDPPLQVSLIILIDMFLYCDGKLFSAVSRKNLEYFQKVF